MKKKIVTRDEIRNTSEQEFGGNVQAPGGGGYTKGTGGTGSRNGLATGGRNMSKRGK